MKWFRRSLLGLICIMAGLSGADGQVMVTDKSATLAPFSPYSGPRVTSQIVELVSTKEGGQGIDFDTVVVPTNALSALTEADIDEFKRLSGHEERVEMKADSRQRLHEFISHRFGSGIDGRMWEQMIEQHGDDIQINVHEVHGIFNTLIEVRGFRSGIKPQRILFVPIIPGSNIKDLSPGL